MSEIKIVVKELLDGEKWDWKYSISRRDAADEVLKLLAREGLIEHAIHPHGGNVWRVNGEMLGRTDGVNHRIFDKKS